MAVTIREYRNGDAAGIVRISRENAAFYVRLAPDYFKQPDEEGFVELFENDGAWRDAPENLALVAEVEGEVAGYLEATLLAPLETARWQAQRDLGETRLAINYVGTADAHKRLRMRHETRRGRRGVGAGERRGGGRLRHVHREPPLRAVLGGANGLHAAGDRLPEAAHLTRTPVRVYRANTCSARYFCSRSPRS